MNNYPEINVSEAITPEGPTKPPPPSSKNDAASAVTRRRFLMGSAASVAVGAGALYALQKGGTKTTDDAQVAETFPDTKVSQDRISFPTETTVGETDPRAKAGLLVPGDVSKRILVVVELQGGNDGLSTVVPYGSGTYYDLRPNLAIKAEDVLKIDDEVGLNPALVKIHSRQFAVIEGLGHVNGTQSHFDMEDSWHQGVVDGTKSADSGFLARVANELGKNSDSPLVAVSVSGNSPWLHNVEVPSLSFDSFNQLNLVTSNEAWQAKYRQALLNYQGGPLTTQMHESWSDIFSLGNALPGGDFKFDRDAVPIEGSKRLVEQMAMAAEFVKADAGVQIIHARLSGFDTHQGHEYKHKQLMAEVDYAVDTFLTDIAEAGREQDVLVAVTSEFGRRVPENGSGLDHGAASTLFTVGPVIPGRHGLASPLNDLAKDNLKTQIPFDGYLGTLAQNWLGVEAGAVLEGEPELMDFV